MGGRINAFTTKEFICIYVECLKDHSIFVADLIYKLIEKPLFKQEDIEQEKKVIMNEIYLYKDNYNEICQQNLISATWSGHALSRPILGNTDIISNFKNDYFSTYYYQNLDPEKIVISLSGNFSEKLISKLEDNFSNLKKTSNYSFDIPKLEYKHKYVSVQKNASQNFVMLGFPLYSYTDPKLFSFMIFNQLFGIGSSSKLFKELRVNHGLVYMVHSYSLIYKEGGLFIINASLPNMKDTDYLIEKILLQTNYYRNKGINEDEFNICKLKLKGQMALNFENTKNRMLELGKNEFLGLNNTLDNINSGIDGLFKVVERENINSTIEVIREILSHQPTISIIKGTNK